MRKLVLLFFLVLFSFGTAQATVIFTIDSYSADDLAFTLSGTIDTDTVGLSPGYIAIKNDWSNNFEVHTEIFNFVPVVSLNTITIGNQTSSYSIQNDDDVWMDDIYFVNPLGASNPILAGTEISGSMVLSGSNAFNLTDVTTLELVSGISPYTGTNPLTDMAEYASDWSRFEAGAQLADPGPAPVPEPSTMLLLGSGLMGLAWYGRKRKK